MSHQAYIGYLAHYQPIGANPATFIPPDMADLLVERMVAERISQKRIRAFSPDSPFLKLVPSGNSSSERSTPIGWSAGEIGNLRFEMPTSVSWNETHRAATRSLQTRAFMAMRALRSKNCDRK